MHVLGRSLSPNDWMYYLAWSIALVAFAVAWLILRGRTGRAFRAVRDCETAAVSSGVSLARYKTLAFGVSAAYADVAGGLLLAIASAFVQPGVLPGRAVIFLLVGDVIGGLGGLSGLVVGAIFYSCPFGTARISAAAARSDHRSETQKPGGASIVYGVVLILLMFVLPPNGVGGLVPTSGQLIRTASRSDSR